ncbi:MAG: activator of HSP90 ATPase 1 family protein [Saprospiraceae bacterium]|nr:activator of HSP90 ATPase 1 family protein [Saprospiraceae bacterium]
MERAKVTMEFLFRASPTILYQFLTTPSCLIRWFCDGVDIQGDSYIFIWNGTAQIADLVDDIEEERLRFLWEDAEYDNEYLEFRISTSPVTDETILEIIDFCDADEIEDQKQLWKTQIERLRQETGG